MAAAKIQEVSDAVLDASTVIRVDRKPRPDLSKLRIYAIDVAHLVLGPEPVVDDEGMRLFKEKPRVSLDDDLLFSRATAYGP